MNVLILNFIAYLVWFCVVYYKEKRMSLYSYLILFYCIIAFLGYLTVDNGIYFKVFQVNIQNKLEVTPYIYAFITYWLLFLPFRYLKTSSIRIVSPAFIKKARKLIKIWLWFIIPFLFLKLSEAIISLTLGLGDAYDLRHNAGESLFVYDNVYLKKFNGYGTFLISATIPFVMMFAIVGLKHKEVTVKYALFLITLCFLPSLLEGIAMGSRGGMFMTMSSALFFLFIYWPYITKALLKKLTYFGLIFLLLVLVYAWEITLDRQGLSNDSEGLDSILRYFGESFPNLGYHFWDKVMYHPMGDRLFPNLFFSNSENFYDSVDDSYSYWWLKTGVPVLYFKSFFGDLYIEFGVFGAFVFTTILSFLVKFYFSVKKINYYNVAILFYYFQLCVFGFAGFTKDGHGALFQLIIIISIAVLLKFYFKKKMD